MEKYCMLGGVVDPAQVWSHTGDAGWHEAGAGQWRVACVPTNGQSVKLTAMPHIRSGDGNSRSRLYNKVRIVRVLPTREENLAMNSESLIESAFGYGDQLRFFDSSRTVFVVDRNPVPGVENVYAVEVVAGDGTHTEISYGSPLLCEILLG